MVSQASTWVLWYEKLNAHEKSHHLLNSDMLVLLVALRSLLPLSTLPHSFSNFLSYLLYCHRRRKITMLSLKFKGNLYLIKCVYCKGNKMTVLPTLCNFALSISLLIFWLWFALFRPLCQKDSFKCCEKTVVASYCSSSYNHGSRFCSSLSRNSYLFLGS